MDSCENIISETLEKNIRANVKEFVTAPALIYPSFLVYKYREEILVILTPVNILMYVHLGMYV